MTPATEKARKPNYIRGGNEDVFQQLRVEAHMIVERLESERRGEILLKAFLFPSLYFFTWICAILWGSNPWVFYGCYFAMGLLVVFNYLNIVHDAVHGTIFKSKGLNNAFVYVFDLMGANSFIWKTRHVRYHHNYPNVNGWDTDIEQSDLARVFPSGGYSRIHKYQHIYLPFIYPLFLFNWLVVRDFKDFFKKNNTVKKLVKIPRIEYVKLFLFKGLFFFYMIFLPKLILPLSWVQVILAFIIMVFTASIFALFVLLPPHANTESEFPLPDESNKFRHNWFTHMLKTTNDVNGNNWFTRFCMGCFNYHVVHHLFPNINHVFYPEITQKLKEYAVKHNLPYRSFPILTTLKNHYLLLKQNRMEFDIFEETM